jgi:hypothetical protein
MSNTLQPEERMAIGFTYEDIVTAMLRARGIRAGRWALFVEFGAQALNVAPGPGQPMVPALLAPLLRIGLQQVDGPGQFPGLVDASQLLVV